MAVSIPFISGSFSGESQRDSLINEIVGYEVSG